MIRDARGGAAFNPAQLAEISGGDSDYEREITAEYLEQARDLFAVIGRALAGGEAAVIGRSAHTLRGSSSTIGAEAVAGICAELEHIAASGNLAPAAGLLESATLALAETRVRLAEHFGGRGDGSPG